MNKKNIFLSIFSMMVMVLLPLLVVKIVSADAGMAVCFLLFFVVNPIYSAIVGALVGAEGKMNWLQVFITPILFWIGTAIAFDIGERAFILYASIYAVIILVAMFISYLINRKKLKIEVYPMKKVFILIQAIFMLSSITAFAGDIPENYLRDDVQMFFGDVVY